MSVSAQTGAIGWKIQSAKGAAPAAPYYWHKVISAEFAPVQDQRPMPPEVGGSGLPSSTLKTGAWGAGRMSIIPRLNSIGWLLLSALGEATASGTGPYYHAFPGAADALATRYLSVRRVVPQASGKFGETFSDAKVVALSFTAVPGQQLAVEAQLAALSFSATATPTGAGWDPTTDGGYESEANIPIATKGSIELPDGTPHTTITNFRLDIVNNTPNIQEERVLGSYFPHDVTVLSRNIIIRMTMFWQDALLWRNIYYNGGTSWSPDVWWGGSPFQAEFQTPGNMAGAGYGGRFGISIPSNGIAWSCDPVPLAGGRTIMMNLTGIVNDNSTGLDYEVYIANSKAGAYS